MLCCCCMPLARFHLPHTSSRGLTRVVFSCFPLEALEDEVLYCRLYCRRNRSFLAFRPITELANSPATCSTHNVSRWPAEDERAAVSPQSAVRSQPRATRPRSKRVKQTSQRPDHTGYLSFYQVQLLKDPGCDLVVAISASFGEQIVPSLYSSGHLSWL
jgi:hypothetical protein